jgi:hypothetical protein
MLHRIVIRLASALLVAGLLAAPATAGAKKHHKRHVARHHVAKHHSAGKSLGRTDRPTNPSEPKPSEPAPQPPSHEEPTNEPDPPTEPTPTDPVPPPVHNAGDVASFHEGVLDVELDSGGHVVGRVIAGGTQFVCRSAASHETVVEGCNASLLTMGASLHEFSVNYGPDGAWFQRIIIVLP